MWKACVRYKLESFMRYLAQSKEILLVTFRNEGKREKRKTEEEVQNEHVEELRKTKLCDKFHAATTGVVGNNRVD